MNQLDAALQNASINRQLTDPQLPPVDYIANQPTIDYDAISSTPIASYQEKMEREYAESYGSRCGNITPHPQEDIRCEIIKLSYMIEGIRATIAKAAEEPTSVKHRSLSQWSFDDLLTELIERENDLNPYYFELLKRIQNQELLTQVDGCMNAKMYCSKTLALICSAMNSAPPGNVE
jgi:hypothetical protein